MHILLVDDEESIRKAFARLLRQVGYTVECSSDGEEAAQIIDLQPVDLVIADIRMPNMDGFELLHLLQAKTPDLPVILMSGYIDNDLFEKADREGAYMILSKPIDIEGFLEIVGEIKNGCLEVAQSMSY